ncbi:hypothetical protein [Spiroplasma cantharicola]|uniref:hypothetical protein n=1 Tax=Spiroplasma cantharicola TaxID=362837 RepID=UPI00130D56EE|nr:hypothetical protein [Spiroplasma cantharicola]
MNTLKRQENEWYASGRGANSVIKRYGSREEILKFSNLANNADFFYRPISYSL